MCNKFIVQGRSVLLNFDLIDSHGGHFRDDDSSQGVCHRQISVSQLELDRVAVNVQDLDLWTQSHVFVIEVWVAN